MKRIIADTVFAFLALAAVSCSEKPIEKEIHADGFKAVFSEGDCSWQKGDRITVNDKNGASAIYQTEVSGEVATFSKASGDNLTEAPYTAYYPEGLPGKMQVDSIQNGQRPEGTQVHMMAESNSTVLPFRELLGYLQVDVISQIDMPIANIRIVSDQPLCGAYKIEKGEAVASQGASCLEMINANPGSNEYTLVTLPGTFRNLEITVTAADGGKYFYQFADSLVVAPGKTSAVTFNLGDARQMSAILKDGPDVNAVIKAVAPAVEKIVLSAGENILSGTSLSEEKESTGRIVFEYSASEKTGYIKTDVSIIKSGKDMSRLFSGLTALKTIEGLEHLDTRRATDMSSLFEGCSALESLNLTGFDTDRVKDMSHMFRGCAALASLDLSGLSTSNTTSMSGMFSDCSSLVNLNVSSFDTRLVTAMDSMFFACSAFKAVDISNFNAEKVTTTKAMFAFCSSLDSLDLDLFDTFSLLDGSYMFYKCTAMKVLRFYGLYTVNLAPDCSAMIFGDVNLGDIYFSGNFYGAIVDSTGNFACYEDTPFEERVGSVPGAINIYTGRSPARMMCQSSLRWINSGYEGKTPIPITIYQHRFGLVNEGYDLMSNVYWASDVPIVLDPNDLEPLVPGDEIGPIFK